ncbi:hypothetical protein HY500_02305, partial [Candidatus Woesearchaeota archaeon]|nr:hypothetical protein [Candidatus Woesearchaeota archaeon]
MKNLFILILGILFLFFFSLVDAQISDLTSIENLQELTIDNTTYQVFSAYNDSVQGIYYQVKGDETTLNPVYNSGQNNSHPKIIGFD